MDFSLTPAELYRTQRAVCLYQQQRINSEQTRLRLTGQNSLRVSAGLCGALRDSAGLCGALWDSAGLCGALRGSVNPDPGRDAAASGQLSVGSPGGSGRYRHTAVSSHVSWTEGSFTIRASAAGGAFRCCSETLNLENCAAVGRFLCQIAFI